MSRIERPGPSEQFSSLRHGDVVVLECDGPPGWEGIMSSDSRSAQDMDVVYHKKGGTNDPAFLSKCVFRVDTSRGEEAPGAPVYFGNPVRLQLLRTRQFVTATNAPSKQAKRSFRLSLNKTRSKDCFLRLQPHLKIRSEGELVYYGEPTGLQDANGRYLRPVNPPLSAAAAGSSDSATPVVSGDERCAWRLRRFMQYDASLQNVIKFGDLLRLFHMEEEAFLVGHIVDTDLRRRDDFALTETVNEKLEALYERSFVNVGETVQMPHRMFVGLRNSGAKRKSRTKHSVQSIWEIHNDKGALGGPVAFSQTVRLRHFATGAFLCIRERKTASGAGTGNNEAMVLPQLVTPEDEADTLFAFEYVSNNEAPSGGGGAGDISGGAGGGSSGSSALESSLTAGSGEGSSSSDNGSGVYLSLHALMRLVHVTTREYVTAGLRAGSDGHPAGSVADGNGSDTGSALSGSATGTANSGQGGAGGVMVGGLLKSLQFKGPGGNVNYDDGDDNVRDANDAIRENDDLAALAGTRTLLLQKERAIRTAQDNPDECVYQVQTVSAEDVDRTLAASMHSDKLVQFVAFCESTLAQADTISTSSKGQGTLLPPPEAKASSSSGSSTASLAAATTAARSCGDALACLVAFVCDLGVMKWADALNVTSPPVKVQQNVLIEKNTIELLLMLAHSIFNCISALEKSFAATKSGRAAIAKNNLKVSLRVSRESRALAPLSSKKSEKSATSTELSSSSQHPRHRARSAPSSEPPRKRTSKRRPPVVARRKPSVAGVGAAIKNAAPKAYLTSLWPLGGKAPSLKSPMGTSLDGYEQPDNQRVPPSAARASSSPSLTPKLSGAGAGAGAVLAQVPKIGIGGFGAALTTASSKAAMACHKYLRATLPTRTALNELGNLCYKLLSLTVVGTKKAVPRIMGCDGVDLMIKHKLNTSPAWSPPIREVLAANSAGNNSTKRLKTIFKTDVRLLLNKVYEKTKAHEVPDADMYSFLADVCAPNDLPEKDVQGWVRELFLGLSMESATSSCLLYATKLEDPKRASATGAGSAAATAANEDDWSAPLPPSSSSSSSSSQGYPRRRVLVEVSGFGKGRPKYSPDKVVEFRGQSPKDMASQPGGVSETYDLVSPSLGLTYEQWRDTADDYDEAAEPHHPLLAGKWVALQSLDSKQLRFFASSINLLGVLCAGRNGASQRMVKKLLPVDTILECLEELSDLGLSQTRDKEGFAILHTAFVRVLQNLHVQAVALEKVSEGTLEDSTLIWTLGEEDVADDYEDVRVEVLNKIFSAATQFDEPRATNEVMDAEEALSIIERYDIGFLKRPDVVALERMSVDGATGAQSTSGAYDAALVAQAKKVLRRRWSEFMLVDLGSFTQRYRLRTTVFKTMRAMEKFAKQEGGKDLFGSPKAMEAAHAFLVLVRELVTSNFFSPIYEVYPRCELVIGGVKEEPFFYRRTKQMLTGTPAQRGTDGEVAPQLVHFFGSTQSTAPVLAFGGDTLVPSGFRTSVDAKVLPAVPTGLEIQAIEEHSLRLIPDGPNAAHGAGFGNIVFVLRPVPGGPLDASGEGTKDTGIPAQDEDAVEVIRSILRSLQKALDPTLQDQPLDSPGQTWPSLAEDASLAEEHFGRAFAYVQKTPLDGLLQKGRMDLQCEILNIWQLSISTNQNLRVATFWNVFQNVYKRHIEDVCFPVQELTDEADAGHDDEDDDEDGDGSAIQKNVDTGSVINGDEVDLDKVSEMLALGQVSKPDLSFEMENPSRGTGIEMAPKRLSTMPSRQYSQEEDLPEEAMMSKARALTEQERNERRYLEHRDVDANAWAKFRQEAKAEVRKVLDVFKNDNRKRLMGDFVVESANIEIQKQRGIAFLNLLLYDNDELSGLAVKILYRHFNRRVEFSSRLINSTLVLESQDKDTLKFVAKRRGALSRCMQQFANPYRGGAVASKDADKRAKATQQRLKNLAEFVCVLFNDPERSPGPLGLVNLCWTPLWDAFDNSSDNDGLEAAAATAASSFASAAAGDSQGSFSSAASGESDAAVTSAPKVLTATERVMVLAGYGAHPLVRGLPREEKVEEMNQQMLGEQGVHETVLEFLKDVVRNERSKDDFDTNLCAEQKQVVKACLVFLFYFCYAHVHNSDLLSTPAYLEVLLNLLPWWEGSEVAVLLAEVLRDNDAGNKMVEGNHVRAFVAMLFDAVRRASADDKAAASDSTNEKGDWTKASSLLDLLASMVESDAGPIMARQELVTQALEEGLKLSSDTPGATDGHLLAAFLYLDTSSVEALLARNQAAENQSEASSRGGGSHDDNDDDNELEDVSSLYRVSRVVEEYERLTTKRHPPRKFETVAKWKAYHLRCKPLPESTHLSFHIKVVDILGMLSKGDNLAVEQWCSLFISEPEMVRGIGLHHPVLKGCYARYMHGTYFSRAHVSGGSGTGGEDSLATDVEDRAEELIERHQQAMVSVFGDFNSYLRLLHRFQLDSAANAMTATLYEEQEDFENVAVDVVLPFLKDFFTGSWSLLPPSHGDHWGSAVAFVAAGDDGCDSSARGGLDTPPDVYGSQERSGRPLLTSAKSFKGSSSGSDSGKDGNQSLLWKCARHPSSIVHQLAKLAGHDKIQKWENARVGVLEALVAARSRRIGGSDDSGGLGSSSGSANEDLMVPPESNLSASIGEAERQIEQFVVQMEAEGIAGDEDEDVIMQRRKKAAVKSALPHFVHVILECLEENQSYDYSFSSTLTRFGSALSSSSSSSSGASGLVIVSTEALLDPLRDPFFDVFVDTIRSRIMNYIRANTSGSDVIGGSESASSSSSPASGVGNSGGGGTVQPPLPLAVQLARLTGGRSIEDALDVLNYNFVDEEDLEASAMNFVEAASAPIEDTVRQVPSRQTSFRSSRRRGSALFSKGQEHDQAATQLTLRARTAAFDVFTEQSKLYMVQLLEHLCGFLSESFTECDTYLALALQQLMASKRREIEEEHLMHSAKPKSSLSSSLADDDLVTKLMQCALINLGAPEAILALVSLGHRHSGVELNSYYAAMVPQANDLANALLDGGNYEAQRRILEIFVAKKTSLESHKEEGFLKSLQQQLRDLQKQFLNPNLDLKNLGQLAAMEVARERAVEVLKFIQNLVEGHQSAHQDFLRVQPGVTETVNLVREVSTFYNALYECVDAEFKLVQDRDFNAKYAPPVAGYLWNSQKSHRNIKTKGSGPGAGSSSSSSSASGDGVSVAAASFGRSKIVAWHEGIDFAKLRVVMPVLEQCLDTLQEVCAGPNLQNQLTVVRAGVCASFPKLFAFFGALQLRQAAPPPEKRKLLTKPVAATRRASLGTNDPAGAAAPKKTGTQVKESAALASFKRTWAAASADLWITSLNDTALMSGRSGGSDSVLGDLSASHSYTLSFGKGHAPGSKWVGNDPALLFMLFRQRMHAEKKVKARLLNVQGGGARTGYRAEEVSYPDDASSLVSLLGTLRVDNSSQFDDNDGANGHVSGFGDLGNIGNIANVGVGAGNALKGLIGDLRVSVSGNDSDVDRSSNGANDFEELDEVAAAAAAAASSAGARSAVGANAFDTDGRDGGWIAAKRAFVAINAGKKAEKWRPHQGDKKGAWRFVRQLRKPPRNIYSDIEDLTNMSLKMEKALVTFVQSIVEGGDVDSEVVDHVVQNWDMSVMFGCAANWLGILQEFSRSFEKASPMHVSRNRVTEVNAMAIQWHILIESMGDSGALGPAFKGDYRELCTLRRVSVSKNGLPLVGRVEVVGKSDQVSLLYFPVPPIVTSCWWRPEVKHERNLILYPDNLSKRSNPDEKIKDFLIQSDGLVDILEHEFMLQELGARGGLQWFVAELGQQSAPLSRIVLILTLIINVLLLFRVGYSNDGSDIEGTSEISYSSLPLWHFISSLLLFASYIVSTGWRNVSAARTKNEDGVVTFYSRERWLIKLAKALGALLYCRPKAADVLSAGGGMGSIGADVSGGSGEARGGSGGAEDDHEVTFVIPTALLAPVHFYASDWRATYYTSFVGVSFIGFAVTPMAFVICMFDVVRMSPTMQKVIRSLTYNIDQVIVTVFFMAILLYLFAAFAFFFNFEYGFEEHYPCAEVAMEQGNCGGDFATWFQLHLDYGVINPLVFTDSDGPITSAQGSIFGFLYYFLINLVITAIVSGIIIDTFAQMRSDRNDVEQDLKGSCFICDIEPEDFEQFNVRFSDHIKQDHNMWQYVWLKIYLRDKDRTQYSGMEMHVAPFLMRHSPRCMPIKKSRAIQGKVRDKATLPTILQKINNMSSSTSQAIEELRRRVEISSGDMNERISKALSAANSAPQQAQPSSFFPDNSGIGGGVLESLRETVRP